MAHCSPEDPIAKSIELIAGRDRETASCGDEGGRYRRFPDPRGHEALAEDSSMLVIRDALLSLLQKDRLRQEIILAELDKIERDIALHSSTDVDRANSAAPFSSLEEMPHSREALGIEDEDHDFVFVAADVDNYLEKDEVREGVELESQKLATEDECLETSCDAGNAAGQQKAALDESKLQEPDEVSSLTWRFPFHLISY
jgi:hypothetical protein